VEVATTHTEATNEGTKGAPFVFLFLTKSGYVHLGFAKSSNRVPYATLEKTTRKGRFLFYKIRPDSISDISLKSKEKSGSSSNDNPPIAMNARTRALRGTRPIATSTDRPALAWRRWESTRVYPRYASAKSKGTV